MQTRETRSDHHHQKGFERGKEEAEVTLEADLILLVRGKGQVLTADVLRKVHEILELHQIPFAEFMRDVRPQFRNNLFNPCGFLIDRARKFRRLSQPAEARPIPALEVSDKQVPSCSTCNGQMFVLDVEQVQPCPECSTPEFRQKWVEREAERAIRQANSKQVF